MAAPTFVTEQDSGFTGNVDVVTTASFNGLLGDVVAAFQAEANFQTGETHAISGSVESWTQGSQSTGGNDADSIADSGYTILTADRTGMTVSDTRTGGTDEHHGVQASVWRGSDGVGNVAASGSLSAPPSWSFTTSFANSAVVCIFVDWNATDGTTRTWRTVNSITPTAGNGFEMTYYRDTSDFAVYIARYGDVGAAGAKTLGLTAPSGMKCVAAAIEIRGSTGGAAAAKPKSLNYQAAVYRSYYW